MAGVLQDKPYVSKQAGAAAPTKHRSWPRGSRALPPGKRCCNCAGSCQRLVSCTERSVAIQDGHPAISRRTSRAWRNNKSFMPGGRLITKRPGPAAAATKVERGTHHHVIATTRRWPFARGGCRCTRTGVEAPLKRRCSSLVRELARRMAGWTAGRLPPWAATQHVLKEQAAGMRPSIHQAALYIMFSHQCEAALVCSPGFRAP